MAPQREPAEHELAIGLDLGTGGARAVAVNMSGRLVAAAHSVLPRSATHVDGPRVEQDPHAWTAAAQESLRALTERVPASCKFVGIAVDATSGTFVLVDEDHHPLTRGLMYNDLRAAELAAEVAGALGDDLAPYGVQIAGAFALPKIIHVARHQPRLFQQCRRIVHQTDWVSGMLCGNYDVTDVSTALKTGVDPGALLWPSAIEQALGVSVALLPRVVLPGTEIGAITPEASDATRLPEGTPVVAGCTDGTAGCLASGARQSNDLNVTLGTTLVFKAISPRPLLDPDGAIYNHRHPAGGYLPGAASSTGGEWVDKYFAGVDLDAMGRDALDWLPTRRAVYPLVKRGERFPFASATARGFGLEDIDESVERFAAGMEGVAFLERMGIARLEGLGLKIGPQVYATGGGAAGATWMRIRAAVNRRTYCVPKHPECAVGAAILAAVPHFGSCQEAVAAMVQPGRTVEPDPKLSDRYEGPFEQFCDTLRDRGYL